MDEEALRAMVREELKKVTEGKGAELECQECGKKFRKANPTGNTKCPKCGSHDLELGEAKKKRNRISPQPRGRSNWTVLPEKMLNESLGDFLDRTLGDLDHVIISLAQEKHIDVKEFKMLQMYLVKVMRKFDVTLKKKAPRGWKGSHLKEISERILKEKYAGNLGKEVSKAVKNLKTIVLELSRLKYITGDEFRHHFHHYYVFYDRVFKNLLKGKGLDGY